jgi:hypothetical protein
MSGKLVFGGLVAVAVMAVSAGTASAHPPGYGGGYYRPVVVQPVYQPVYRPVVVSPYGGGWGSPVYGGGWNNSVYGGFNNGFYNRPVYGGGFYGGGFGPGVGIGFNNGFYNRPSFGLSFNFIR